MREQLLRIRKDIRDIAKAAGRISTLLNAMTMNQTPSRYQSVIREAAALRTMWLNHCRLLSAFFAAAAAGNGQGVDLFEKTLEDNAVIAGMLDRLIPPRWPRSAHLGLNLIRSVTAQVFPSVLRQLRREESLLRTLSRRRQVVPQAARTLTVETGQQATA